MIKSESVGGCLAAFIFISLEVWLRANFYDDEVDENSSYSRGSGRQVKLS